MAIGSPVYGTQVSNADAASLAVPYPASPENGDVLVIWAYCRENLASAFSQPATWNTHIASTATANGSYAVYYKSATGSESGTLTLTCSQGGSASNTQIARMMKLSGSDKLLRAGTQDSTHTASPYVNAGVTPGQDGSRVFLFGGVQDCITNNETDGFATWSGGTNVTDWSGVSFGTTTGGDAAIGMGSGLQSTDAATGNIQVTLQASQATYNGVSVSFAIRPTALAGFESETALASDAASAQRITTGVNLFLKGTNTATSGTTVTVSGVTTTGPSLIIIGGGHAATTTGPNAITGVTVGGVAATHRASYYFNNGSKESNCEIWTYYSSGALSSVSVVATYTGTIQGGAIAVIEATNADSIGATNSNVTGNSATESGSLTTTVDASVVFAAFINAASAGTAGSNTDEISDVAAGAGFFQTANNNQTTTSGNSYSVTETLSGAWYWNCVLAEVKPVVSAGGAEVEAAGASDAPSASHKIVSAEAETALASDANAVALKAGLGDAESALASDASSAALVAGGSVVSGEEVETSLASDAVSVSLRTPGTEAESALASDASASVVGAITGEAETSIASDAASAVQAAQSAEAETALASDASAVAIQTAVAQSETAVASDADAALASVQAAEAETALSADAGASKAGYVSAEAETGIAADSGTSLGAFVAAEDETALAADTEASTLSGGGSIVSGAEAEIALASDAASALVGHTSAEAESALGSDAESATAAHASAEVEAAPASDAASSIQAFTAAENESALAQDASAATATFIAAQDEGAAAADALSSFQLFATNEAEAALAADACAAAVFSAGVGTGEEAEAALASDACAAAVMMAAGQMEAAKAADRSEVTGGIAGKPTRLYWRPWWNRHGSPKFKPGGSLW